VSGLGARAGDELEIRQVLGRYARGCDRLDMDLVRSCYWDDATEDRGRYVGDVDGFVDWLRGQLEGFIGTWHQVAPPYLEFDGDTAWSESYSLAMHRYRDDDGKEASRLIPSRYCDRFEKRDGEWRIARRIGVYETVLMVGTAPSLDAEPRSRRDRDDPSYQRP